MEWMFLKKCVPIADGAFLCSAFFCGDVCCSLLSMMACTCRIHRFGWVFHVKWGKEDCSGSKDALAGFAFIVLVRSDFIWCGKICSWWWVWQDFIMGLFESCEEKVWGNVFQDLILLACSRHSSGAGEKPYPCTKISYLWPLIFS